MKRTLAVLCLALACSFPTGPSFSQTATPTIPPNCCLLQSTNNWDPPTLQGINLAIDLHLHRIYVAETAPSKVTVLGYDGTYQATLGQGLVTVGDAFVALDPVGRAYLAERETGKVWRLKPGGGGTLMNPGFLAAGIRSLHFDASGNFYLMTDGDGLFEFDAGGNQVWIAPSGELSAPTGLVKVGTSLYVADTLNNRIVRYEETGPDSHLYQPLVVEVADSGSNPILPYGLFRDLAGNFYSANFGLSMVIHQAPAGSWTEVSRCSVGDVLDVVVDETGAQYVLAFPVGNVMKLAPCTGWVQPTPTPGYYGLNPPSAGGAYLYPSPVRGGTAQYACRLSASGRLRLKIWNENGELAGEFTGQFPAGAQSLVLDLSRLVPGVYLHRGTIEYDSGSRESLKPGKFAVIR